MPYMHSPPHTHALNSTHECGDDEARTVVCVNVNVTNGYLCRYLLFVSVVEKAYKELLDPALRDPYIRTHAEKGEQNKEAGWVPSAKGSSTIDQCQKDIDRQNKVERMKKNKFDTFQSRIRDKLMERIKKRKRPSSSASSHDSYYHSDDDKDDGDGKDDYGNSENESDAGGSGDSDEEEGGKSAIKRSRRHGRQSKFRRKGGAF